MANNKLSFAQVNIQHCKSATIEVNNMTLDSNNFIIFIQEPYIKKNAVSNFDPRRFNIISHIGLEKVRTCILASKNCDILPLRQFCKGDVTAALLKFKINGNEQTIIVASTYMPYDRNLLPPNQEFTDLVNYSKIRNLPLLTGCDANSHHLVWGSTNCNPQGEALLSFILTSNLETLNVGNEPTFVTSTRHEVIDITLCSIHISHLIKSWKVTNKVLTSDHRCITFHIKTDHTEFARFRNPKFTDWDKFNENLSKLIPNAIAIDSKSVLNSTAAQLSDAIVGSFKIACPEKVIKASRSADFFTSDVKKLRKELRAAFNRAKPKLSRPNSYGNTNTNTAYINATSRDNFIALRRIAQKKYNKAIRHNQRSLLKQAYSSINSSSASAHLIKSMAKDPHCAIGTLKLPSGEYTQDEASTLNHLLNFHFPGSSPSNDINNSNNTIPVPGNILSIGDKQIAEKIVTKDRIRWAIESFVPLKSAGEDDIIPLMLQKSLHLTLNVLYELFIASISLIYIPKIWRGVRVVFIPKLGQLVYTLAKSFRPISLTSFLLKTLEKLVNRYLRDGVLQQYKIHPKQHAYQPQKSAESALHQLVGRAENALEQEQFALGGFIDLSNAFSNMMFMSITNSCFDHGIDSTTTSWIYAMLSSRVVSARIGTITMIVLTCKGCPRG